jgi:uncharacterized protein involved in exopolysaccharide biosynthesis
MEKRMQDLLGSESDKEMDLRELFLTLWAYKLFIIFTCALSIICSGYYLLTVDKEYTSTAIFKLNTSNSGGISVGGEINVLASLAGFGGGKELSDLPIDLVTGRIFIQKLDAKLNFQSDPYFNAYNPDYVDPIWKSLIKRTIGWQKPSLDTQEVIWQSIIEKYTESILLDETLEGSIKIMVTHVNPQRAARIANVIMDEVISIKKETSNREQDQQLSYLSNTLAKALSDLEVSQSELKQFALEKGALPLESFATGSLQLESLRVQLSQTSELHEAVATLSLMLKNKTTDHKDYLVLREKFPIVDQVEFRRVLGQNEIISFWSWPEADAVNAVFSTLSERKSRLQSQINASQIDAERSRLVLDNYAKLERNAKVAEATYTILIEQVKAQSTAAGYRPNKTEIFEYASASINPSAPARSLILALGAFLGLFLGCLLSLVLALPRGVYFSRKSLITGSQARLAVSVKTLLPLRNKSLEVINTMIVKKPRPVLRNMAVEIHKSAATQVVVTSSRAKMTANYVALALASYMQTDTTKIAVINFSSRDKKIDIGEDKLSIGSFDVAESADQISVLIPQGNLSIMELISHKDFCEKIQSLNSTFDLVFLCADNSDAISLLSALEGQKTFHVTLARNKNTKSATLAHMRSLLPIQGLLYD